jgi:hypothetical protein
MTNDEPKQLTLDQLANVNGGMNLDKSEQSRNIEDRRSKAAVRRENNWWHRRFGSPGV